MLVTPYASGAAAPFQIVCRFTGAPMRIAPKPLAALDSPIRSCCPMRAAVAASHPNKPGGSALSVPCCCDLRQSPDRADTLTLAPALPQTLAFAFLVPAPSAPAPAMGDTPNEAHPSASDRPRGPPCGASHTPRGPPFFS